jgi:hypothetical protein
MVNFSVIEIVDWRPTHRISWLTNARKRWLTRALEARAFCQPVWAPSLGAWAWPTIAFQAAPTPFVSLQTTKQLELRRL